MNPGSLLLGCVPLPTMLWFLEVIPLLKSNFLEE